MSKKVNYHTVQHMREQYKYAKERLQSDGAMAEMLEYETVLWERQLDVSLREGIKKGTLPKVVSLNLYKRVKEAWVARVLQEKEPDGGPQPV